VKKRWGALGGYVSQRVFFRNERRLPPLRRLPSEEIPSMAQKTQSFHDHPEEKRMKKQGNFISAVTTLAFAALTLAASPAGAQSGNNLEIIHHPNYDRVCSCLSRRRSR
jgi:hypothetical protein